MKYLTAFAAVLIACATLLSIPASAALPETVQRVKPSVLAIGTFQRTRNPAFQFRGTGFVVGDGRLVVTNAHVLPNVLDSEHMETLAAVLPGAGENRPVRTLKRLVTDSVFDLAVLRIEDGSALPALSLGGKAQEGQAIAFTGFPIGAALGMTPATHRGTLAALSPIAIPQAHARDLNSALIRRLSEGGFYIYQLDAVAYPGNSGSPLYDPESGVVLGIVNSVLVKSTKESALSAPSGISYAIPVEYIKRLLEQGQAKPQGQSINIR
jgi:S1-C subfamily serine protease